MLLENPTIHKGFTITATASQRRDGRWVGSYISQNRDCGAYEDTCDDFDCSNEKEAQQLALSIGWRLADSAPVMQMR